MLSEFFLLIFLLFLLLSLSAFFSASESSLLSFSHLKLKHLLKTNPTSRRVKALADLKSNIEKTLFVILIGNNIVNIAFSIIVTYLAVKYFGENAILPIGALSFIFIVLFGEILPKNLAVVHSQNFSLFVSIPLKILQEIFRPLTFIFEKFTFLLLKEKLKRKQQTYFSESELRTILEIGVENKTISKDEKKFFERILDFNDTYIKEIMIPAKQVKTLNQNLTIGQALELVAKYKKTFYPVVDQTNSIVGTVNLKDMIGKNHSLILKDILQPPVFVSTESIAYDVFKELQDSKKDIAVVINPESKIEGLITIEDLVEEIVGEIGESEPKMPKKELKEGRPSLLVVNGETSLHHIEKEFSVSIPEAEKLGFVSNLFHFYLKRLPQKGDKIILNGIKMEVIETGQLYYLQKVHIQKIS
ncbi:MAG: hemolysin family protein [Candidatus Anstonellaceae archaeon]